MYKLVAVNSHAVESVENLKRLGIDVFEVKNSNIYDCGTELHADMLMVMLDSHNLLIDSTQLDIVNCISKYFKVNLLSKNEFVNYLTNKDGESAENTDLRGINVIPVEHKITSPYPNDVALNIRIINNNIICNTKYVADEVKIYAEYRNYNLIHTNQGYSGCSSVNLFNSLITDDISVYNSSIAAGIKCNLISKGSVKLKHNNYGFIGGCCGFIADNMIAFNGEISTHSDCKTILELLQLNNIDYIELAHGQLNDIGGIIPVIK
ncbi:MAG: hypothetical protein PUB20_05080 [Clostridia bacterium]|nr:hypothetical protein [Clostridia bacterium]